MIARCAYKERYFIGHGLFLNSLVNPRKRLDQITWTLQAFPGRFQIHTKRSHEKVLVAINDCKNQQMFL